MAESKASIEERLSQLIQESGKKSFCDRLPVRIFVIATWVLLAGIIGLTIFFVLEWRSTSSDIDTVYDKIQATKNKIKETELSISSHQVEIDKANVELTRLAVEIATYTKSNTELKDQVTAIKAKIEGIKAEITNDLKLIQDEDQTHVKLEAEEKQLTKDLESVTKIVNEIKIQLVAVNKTFSTWKFFNSISYFGSALTAVVGFAARGEVAAATKHLAQAKVMKEGFASISESFENWLFLSESSGSKVNREECFRWKSHGSPSSCNTLTPTIVTIKADDGYRFGVILNGPWVLDIHSDANALGFSDNHVKIVKGKEPISVLTNMTYFSFGKGDIAIDLITGLGTTVMNSFEDPTGSGTFFHAKHNFVLDELYVESIKFE